jgi:uncharacterized membrane protein
LSRRFGIEAARTGTVTPAESIHFVISSCPPQEIGLAAQARKRKTLYIVGLGLIALLLKLIIAFNTFGSTDAVVFYTFAKALSREGLEFTYRHSILFNHPPLTAHYLQLIFYLDQQPIFQSNGLTFPVLLRLPSILADFVVVLTLLEIPEKCPEIRIPAWSLALFALSPVSLMVSGFHGNTDPVMVMFLVLAAFMCLRNKPALAGLFLALSCQIKVIPLLFVPIFLLFYHERGYRARFLLPFAFGLLLSWSEALVRFPALFVRNVLSYGGFWGIWGIGYWLRLTGLPGFNVVNFFHLPLLERVVITTLKLVIIAAVLIIAWRRRKLSSKGFLDSLAYAWLIFFVLAPSVSAQYLVWLAPFMLVLSPSFYGWLTAASSIFLFFFYNVTAGGFPWYFAMSTNKLNSVWTPWSLWPWASLIVGMILFWQKARVTDPSLHLFSLKTLPAEARE